MTSTKTTDEKNMIQIRIRNPVYGSKDPDPSENVTEPEHCREEFTLYEHYVTTNPYLCVADIFV